MICYLIFAPTKRELSRQKSQYEDNVTSQLNNLVTIVPTSSKMEINIALLHYNINTKPQLVPFKKKIVQVCMKASTHFYRVEKKANLLRFLIGFFLM